MNSPSPKNPNRSVASLLFIRLGQLVFIAAYALGIYQAYMANGFWKALIVAIPIVGILIWAGVQYYAVGLNSSFFYLLFSAAVLYIVGNVLWPKPARH